MIRKFVALALLAGSCALVTNADDAKKPAEGDGKRKFEGKFDKAKLFEKWDANGDGKVSKEEYKKAMQAFADQMKEKGGEKGAKFAEKAGEFAEQRFKAMDKDGDGVVSKEEFEKAEFGPPGGFKGKGKPPEKPKTD